MHVWGCTYSVARHSAPGARQVSAAKSTPAARRASSAQSGGQWTRCCTSGSSEIASWEGGLEGRAEEEEDEEDNDRLTGCSKGDILVVQGFRRWFDSLGVCVFAKRI
eukprot:GHVT01079081.1.p1 GENE.GHVT01079081.1~~GHVT01079081.1.p1  ORF type:complete len:107 (+),score=22.70 GHVT01079081.1:730-1050(+)